MMNFGTSWNWGWPGHGIWYSYPLVPPFIPFILPLVLIELILKTLALWKAARNGQKYWFVALVFINTAGLLPILYLLLFQRKATPQAKNSKK